MSTKFIFANNVNTTLNGGITASATTITLSSTAGLPASIPAGEYFAVTLNDAATQSVFEVVYASAISGANLTVIRGQEGTTAQAWLSGDYAYASATAGILGSFTTNSGGGGSSGYSYLPGGGIEQWGIVTGVPSDGSAAGTVTFPISFPSACDGVQITIINNFATLPRGYGAPQVVPSPSTTGASIYITGGNAGETVSVYFKATGH